MFEKWKEQRKIRKEVYKNAIKLADETYKKEIEYRKLTTLDLNYGIIQDLIKSAKFVGKITINLKDGTSIDIVDDNNPQADNSFKRTQLY